jgi:hypothetical protein
VEVILSKGVFGFSGGTHSSNGGSPRPCQLDAGLGPIRMAAPVAVSARWGPIQPGSAQRLSEWDAVLPKLND